MSKREYNFDLLRIVSMIMVVFLHAFGKGGVLDSVNLFSYNYFIVQLIEGYFFIAVNVFILISGYFLVGRKTKSSNLLKIIIQTFFYSITIYAILTLLNITNFSYKDIPNVLFPVLSRQYWFVTIYVAFYLLVPFLNLFIDNLKKRTHELLIIVLTVLFSVWPTLIFYEDSLNLENGYSLLWFIFLFFIGSYIKIHFNDKRFSLKKKFLYFIIIGGLVPLSRYFIAFGTQQIFGRVIGSGFFYRYNSFLVFIASVLFFLIFKDLSINEGKLTKTIRRISPHMLAVYIIHTNPYLQDFIWDLINLPEYVNSPYLLLYVIVAVSFIFVTCVIIEMLRVKLFDTLFKSNIFVKLTNYLDNVFYKELLIKNEKE